MKYIIEIENEPFVRNNDSFLSHGMDKLYKAKGFKSLVFDKDGLDKLTPYTESDRQDIEDEVWEFALKLMEDVEEPHFRSAEMVDCFCKESARNVMMDGYQEAKAKYETWKSQKDEIRVGDEVEISGTIGIVTRVPYLDEERVHYIAKSGTVYCNNAYAEIKKTGRHFDEVEALLKKMGDEK